MPVGCYQFHSNPGSNIPSAVSVAPPEDEQVMLETCRGFQFLINLIKLYHVDFIILGTVNFLLTVLVHCT
jgi:hypothetical protein